IDAVIVIGQAEQLAMNPASCRQSRSRRHPVERHVKLARQKAAQAASYRSVTFSERHQSRRRDPQHLDISVCDDVGATGGSMRIGAEYFARAMIGELYPLAIPANELNPHRPVENEPAVLRLISLVGDDRLVRHRGIAHLAAERGGESITTAEDGRDSAEPFLLEQGAPSLRPLRQSSLQSPGRR